MPVLPSNCFMFDDKREEKVNLVRTMLLTEVGLLSVFKHPHLEQYFTVGMPGRYNTILMYHFDSLRLSAINYLINSRACLIP